MIAKNFVKYHEAIRSLSQSIDLLEPMVYKMVKAGLVGEAMEMNGILSLCKYHAKNINKNIHSITIDYDNMINTLAKGK